MDGFDIGRLGLNTAATGSLVDIVVSGAAGVFGMVMEYISVVWLSGEMRGLSWRGTYRLAPPHPRDR